jgi:hypothetical protein
MKAHFRSGRPERSEGPHGISTSTPVAIAMRSFASLRMTTWVKGTLVYRVVTGDPARGVEIKSCQIVRGLTQGAVK